MSRKRQNMIDKVVEKLEKIVSNVVGEVEEALKEDLQRVNKLVLQ